ncbi:hypothetical protein M9Y10_008073 [Tritrichomonas musculus]|uniref:Uncharacterized protein n=1 Tax=Tritrichomonas musculus TaxID=1915356 RepID=A0ABR2IXC1_9EUKA
MSELNEKENATLSEFIECHRRLVTIDRVIRSQFSSQKEITSEVIKCSKDEICELRLLSLVRMKLIRSAIRTDVKIVSSQTFKGLIFSKLEYCPTFTDSNKLNHYSFLVATMRKNPDILAQALFFYSLNHPEKLHRLAYSLFLTLFQQGWSFEEDMSLCETLKYLADIQFRRKMSGPKKSIDGKIDTQGVTSNPVQNSLLSKTASDNHSSNSNNSSTSNAQNAVKRNFAEPPPPRLLKYPLSAVETSCARYQPFITFATAYLFNGASFAYLQTALAPIITKLHSLSHLFDLRSTFNIQKTENSEIIAPIQYLKEIVSYAHQVLISLTNCLQLLPPSFPSFFAYLRQKKVDLHLIVFESFINRALDNPSVLGLLPWHPSHGDWNPSKDIADIFRTKFLDSLKTQSLRNQKKILENIEEYQEINIEQFLLEITQSCNSSYMISEAELQETNPAFPKELLITGSDCLLLHKVMAEFKKPTDEMKKALQRLGDLDAKTPDFKEHFRMVINRSKDPYIKFHKSPVNISLFDSSKLQSPQTPPNSPKAETEAKTTDGSNTEATNSGEPNANAQPTTPPDNAEKKPEKDIRDDYAEQLCDIISGLPPFHESGAKSISEFISISRYIAPYFLDSSLVVQADAVFWYAQSILHKEEDIVRRIVKVVEKREKRGVVASDRTSSLRAQHQRILSSLSTVKSMRENLQSNFNLELSEILISTTMSQNFKDAMVLCHEFINNSEIFKKTVISIKKSATDKLEKMNLTEKMINEVCRLLFFKLTDHITFKRYIQSCTDVWKKSIILTSIIDKNRQQLLEYAERGQPDTFFIKKNYFERAADLLGHIRQNSGMSIILYYVLETENVIQTVCKSSRDLDFTSCLLWVFIKTKAKHVYMLSKFIQHFILQGGFLDRFFLSQEISNLGIFSSSVLLLLKACKSYDKRIEDSWA